VEYIEPYFENKEIKCCLSEYYIKMVNDMVNQILNSSPWKRMWTEAQINNKWWSYDYWVTQRSSFPDWSKFFFEKNKYTNNINLWEILENWKILLEKWYNWNSKEFISILKKSYNKPLTERQWNALEEAFKNFINYIEDYEYLYWEKYISDEIIEEEYEVYNSKL